MLRHNGIATGQHAKKYTFYRISGYTPKKTSTFSVQLPKLIKINNRKQRTVVNNLTNLQQQKHTFEFPYFIYNRRDVSEQPHKPVARRIDPNRLSGSKPVACFCSNLFCHVAPARHSVVCVVDRSRLLAATHWSDAPLFVSLNGTAPPLTHLNARVHAAGNGSSQCWASKREQLIHT